MWKLWVRVQCLPLRGSGHKFACWSICLEISRDSKAPFTLRSQGTWSVVSPLPVWVLVPWRQGLTPRVRGAGVVAFWLWPKHLPNSWSRVLGADGGDTGGRTLPLLGAGEEQAMATPGMDAGTGGVLCISSACGTCQGMQDGGMNSK